MDAQRPTWKSLASPEPLKTSSESKAEPARSKWVPLLSTLKASWPLITIIVIQALIAVYSIYILSAVRTYVGGESLWSKGQKDAIYQLSRYAETGDDSAYAAYLSALKIPQGNREARIAIMHSELDYEAASKGFARAEPTRMTSTVQSTC